MSTKQGLSSWQDAIQKLHCSGSEQEDPVTACCSHGSILDPVPETAQQRFDAQYISSNEIAERLGVSRPSVLGARTRGVLPDPVCVNGGQIYVWERATVEPYLKAWEVSVKLRRGETVTIPLTPVSHAQAEQ